VNSVLPSRKRLIRLCLERLHTRFVQWTKPFTSSLPLGTLADLARSKAERVRGKCALTTTTHHAQASSQTTSMHEDGSHPACARSPDCSGLEANAHHSFNQKPCCGFHRELFRLYWKRRSRASSHKPKIAAETIAFIREMATKNRLWGLSAFAGKY
jgi:putative transposase